MGKLNNDFDRQFRGIMLVQLVGIVGALAVAGGLIWLAKYAIDSAVAL